MLDWVIAATFFTAIVLLVFMILLTIREACRLPDNVRDLYTSLVTKPWEWRPHGVATGYSALRHPSGIVVAWFHSAYYNTTYVYVGREGQLLRLNPSEASWVMEAVKKMSSALVSKDVPDSHLPFGKEVE